MTGRFLVTARCSARPPFRFNACVFLAWAVIAGVAQALAAQDVERYDVVLAGGRVMDPESGLDAVRYVGL